MPRSLKKGPFIDDHLFQKIKKANKEKFKKTYKNMV
jgi:small subunit ribosomal protein S19